MPGILILSLVCLLACAVLTLRLNAARSRQREMVARIRNSELYGHLYPVLRRSGERYIETIDVRPDMLTIRFLTPPGDTVSIVYDEIGADPLEPQPLYALAQAISVDLPFLQDSSGYEFIVRSTARPDGASVRWYTYNIRHDYKDSLLRTARGE